MKFGFELGLLTSKRLVEAVLTSLLEVNFAGAVKIFNHLQDWKMAKGGIIPSYEAG